MTSPQEHLDDGPGGSPHVPPADPAATAVSIACPGCRRLVPVGSPCRSCGRTATPRGVTRDLTVVLDPAPDATLVMEAVPPAAPVMAAEPPAAPVMAAVPWAPPVPGRSRPRRGPAAGVLGGAAALVLVAAAAVAGLHSRSGSDDNAAPAGSAQSAKAAAAADRAVPAGSVRASASTTQHPDGSISYVAANTLDGRTATAWNSRGQGAGATLTYTFATPVDLTSVTVLNGYHKVLTGSNGKTVDLFTLNQRVKEVRVTTDAGSVPWTLRDDRAPQTLARAFGRTRTVRLLVRSTYPSREYRDLAVSEVRFTAKS